MTRANSNKMVDRLMARRAERLAQENDTDYGFLVKVLENEIAIGEPERQRFIRLYKKLLEGGQYIARKEGKTVISSKYPEKVAKQLENFDEIIQNVFIKNVL
ncbi:MAG: hypothetical protein A4E56_00114 [Pelotomaculum sp. PtaU1.Bin065]|nr:MAG: hypothetical protein A4E56_00114 [Pelotomaculum sp. PtaU1.Bin065]